MVQFYPWFKFYSPLFRTYYHTLPYPKTRENTIQTKDKIELEHMYNGKVHGFFSPAKIRSSFILLLPMAMAWDAGVGDWEEYRFSSCQSQIPLFEHPYRICRHLPCIMHTCTPRVASPCCHSWSVLLPDLISSCDWTLK